MSARKKASGSTKSLNSDFPLLRWIGTIGIALFLVIFPYEKALFNGYEMSFDSNIYNAVIFGCVLLLVLVAYQFRSRQLNSYRGILSIAVMVLPVVYWLSSFQAVSSYYAKFMTIIFFLLAFLFISGFYFAENKLSRKTIEYALMGSAYLIVIFGLLNLFGQTYARDALWLAHDGYRLTSVFQYSNTYAGFLVAIFLATLYYAVHCIRPSARLIHAAMLVPIWISFMFTYSRGAIVIVPVMVLIIMPFMKLNKQITYILYMILSIVISMAVLGKLTTNVDAIAKLVQPTEEKAPSPISLFSSLPLQNWGLLILAAIVMLALVMLYHAKVSSWLELKLTRLTSYKWSFAAMPVVILLLSAIAFVSLISSSAIRGILPDQLASRFENINLQQHSVLERFTFYKDGLSVAKDYPILGGGGGAWQAMYEEYQNNPYWSRQAHSFFVQVLVETGWIGLIALIGFLGFIYLLYIRSYIRFPELRGSHFIFFILSLTLLVHSAIDFDMSFVYISAIVFLSLGCMLAPYSGKLLIERISRVDTSAWSKAAYPSAMALLAVVLLFTVIRENSAIKKYNEVYTLAVQQQTPLNQMMPMLNAAIKASPKQTAFSVTKANWLEQVYEQTKDEATLSEALSTIDTAKKYDPYNRSLIMAKYRLLKDSGQLEQSLQALEEGIVKFPWDINMYEAAFTSYGAASKEALAKKDESSAKQYEERIVSLTNEINRRIDQLSLLPAEQQQGRSFGFTPGMEQVITELTLAKVD